jgi:hypothetical protein
MSEQNLPSHVAPLIRVDQVILDLKIVFLSPRKMILIGKNKTKIRAQALEFVFSFSPQILLLSLFVTLSVARVASSLRVRGPASFQKELEAT